jgi:hypothetical protein
MRFWFQIITIRIGISFKKGSEIECNKFYENIIVIGNTDDLRLISLDTEHHQSIKLLDYKTDYQQKSAVIGKVVKCSKIY